MNDEILITKHLSKRYGVNGRALTDCSLTVRRGQIYGLVGRNGAGKTTFMRLVCGQSQPTEGEISLFGSGDDKSLIENRKRIGCMIETPVFYPNFSARKNLTVYCMKKGIPIHGQIDEILDFVGLSDTGNKQFSKFSLGMKERLGVALALLGNPEFLVLDEPTNGLDPIGVADMRNLILRLNREKNLTVLLSSHILKEMAMVATNYGFIENGKLIAEMSANELNEKSSNALSVRVSNATSTCAVLERILGIKNYKVMADNSIKIYDCIDQPERINRELSENGIDVYSLSVDGKDLEQFFVDLLREAK